MSDMPQVPKKTLKQVYADCFLTALCLQLQCSLCGRWIGDDTEGAVCQECEDKTTKEVSDR